jgi:hypothetical protein
MNWFLIAALLLILITVMVSEKSLAEENGLYPYETSILPYLNKTMEDRYFWFEVSPDENSWGVDWDKERKAFTTIVIHQSGSDIKQMPEEMEDINKKAYVSRYNSGDNDPYVKGLEPHSFHIVNGKETFVPYHYLIYQDGTVINWLNPLVKKDGIWQIDNVAWHVGNWTLNCESLSVCLIGNLTSNYPTRLQLQSLEKLIDELRGYNPNLTVIPHRTLNISGSKYKEWAGNL